MCWTASRPDGSVPTRARCCTGKRRNGGGDSWYDYWDDNSVQVTARALEAVATLEPNSALIPGVSQWLLANRRGPKWLSTQDTTNVIIAALALKPRKRWAGT